jgi:hypothetical protein
VLLAPSDGYVQQVGATINELVPSFRELFRISPRKPDKVIGFLHESAEVPFQLGDTVLLSSMSRVEISSVAVLNGVSPKLVELPFRLRKFTELRTWGREVYIQLPVDNPFFIGEKILITVRTRNDELGTMNDERVARNEEPLGDLITLSRLVSGSNLDRLPGTRLILTMAPNPATTDVLVTVDGLDENGGILTVFDATGRMVWQQKITSSQRIQLSEFSSGVYQVSLCTEKEMITKSLKVNRL